MYLAIWHSVHVHGSPCSINSRDMTAIADMSLRRARPNLMLIDLRVTFGDDT